MRHFRPSSAVDRGDITDVLNLMSALRERDEHIGTKQWEDGALEAAMAGRAAYWSNATYHNQAALQLVDLANAEGLPAAVIQCCDDTYPSHAKHRLYLLATLTPLNRAACVEMERAVSEAANDACDPIMFDAIARARPIGGARA